MIRDVIALISRAGTWAYLLEGIFVFAEDALFFGFVIPAETVLVLSAFLAQQHALNVWLVLAIAVAAAIAGDQVGFEIGRHYGERIRDSRLGRRISADSWGAAENLLETRGGHAVFLGRWVAFLRALVPTTSGLLKMRWSEFTLWNALGGVAWAVAWTAVGYTAGASWERVARDLGEVTSGVGLLVLFALVWVWRRRTQRARRDKG